MTVIPNETDFHIHAGIERDRPLEDFVRFLQDKGRRVYALLDHAELYMHEPPEWAANVLLRQEAVMVEVGDLQPLMRERLGGPEAFYRHARQVAEDATAIGLEVGGNALERGQVPAAWLDGADFVGICTNQPPAGRAWGAHMALLLDVARKLIGSRPMGLVLHHPFRWRLCDIVQGDAPLPEAVGFTREDASVAAAALSAMDAVAEANFACFCGGRLHGLTDQPGRADEVIEGARTAYMRLRDAGARFSIGSDTHKLLRWDGDYEPVDMLRRHGLTVDDLKLPFAPQAK